jgi:hypothetical protein
MSGATTASEFVDEMRLLVRGVGDALGIEGAVLAAIELGDEVRILGEGRHDGEDNRRDRASSTRVREAAVRAPRRRILDAGEQADATRRAQSAANLPAQRATAA